MTKPSTAKGYAPQDVDRVAATCLYVATKLGDLLDELVVVGGLVPSLLIDQARDDVERHVGTQDLDIGLTLGLLDAKRYDELAARLRAADFAPDVNEEGRETRQRWRIIGPPKVTLDFLIPPSSDADKGGTLRNLRPDFAAIIAPGLSVAFKDQLTKTLSRRTIRDEQATRSIRVCGPAAFVVMKALAFNNRGENKDAYDLVYLLRNLLGGTEELVTRFAPIRTEKEVATALLCLRENFKSVDSIGPRRAAMFIHGARNENAEAEAWATVSDLLDALP